MSREEDQPGLTQAGVPSPPLPGTNAQKPQVPAATPPDLNGATPVATPSLPRTGQSLRRRVLMLVGTGASERSRRGRVTDIFLYIYTDSAYSLQNAF